MSARWVNVDGVMQEPAGYAALWLAFGLSRASWLVLPRALLHEMPDDWQQRMADLLAEYDAAWDIPEAESGEVHVSMRRGGRMVPLPGWLGYRHPDTAKLETFRRKP